MRCTSALRSRRQANRRGLARDALRLGRQGYRDILNSPFEHLLQHLNGDRRCLKERALPDVEAPRSRSIRVAVVHEARKVIRPLARDPVLLQRLIIQMPVRYVEVTEPKGAEQP